MKKSYKKIHSQTVKELEREIVKLRDEIAKEKLEEKVNPPKDTNALFKKQKLLAVSLTILSEKKELEQLKKVT